MDVLLLFKIPYSVRSASRSAHNNIMYLAILRIRRLTTARTPGRNRVARAWITGRLLGTSCGREILVTCDVYPPCLIILIPFGVSYWISFPFAPPCDLKRRNKVIERNLQSELLVNYCNISTDDG